MKQVVVYYNKNTLQATLKLICIHRRTAKIKGTNRPIWARITHGKSYKYCYCITVLFRLLKFSF